MKWASSRPLRRRGRLEAHFGSLAAVETQFLTDEVVFSAAPRDWITVRVGFVPTSAATFFVHNQAEIPTLLNRLVALLRAAPALSATVGDRAGH